MMENPDQNPQVESVTPVAPAPQQMIQELIPQERAIPVSLFRNLLEHLENDASKILVVAKTKLSKIEIVRFMKQLIANHFHDDREFQEKVLTALETHKEVQEGQIDCVETPVAPVAETAQAEAQNQDTNILQ